MKGCYIRMLWGHRRVAKALEVLTERAKTRLLSFFPLKLAALYMTDVLRKETS